MGKLDEIYEGWKNYIFPSPKVEEEAKRRIEICVKNECKKFKKNDICGMCGCYMPIKVRSIKSHCVMGKW